MSESSYICSAGLLICKCYLYWGQHPPFLAFPTSSSHASYCNFYIPQAVKDVRSSRKTVIDIFEHIENLFRRLEIYTAVSPTPEMTYMLVKIMVEVLSILGIATKETKQN